jgi:hypothetical protein
MKMWSFTATVKQTSITGIDFGKMMKKTGLEIEAGSEAVIYLAPCPGALTVGAKLILLTGAASIGGMRI